MRQVPARVRRRRITWTACVACGNRIPACTVTAFTVRVLTRPCAAPDPDPDRYLLPRQGFELGKQRRLVAFHGQHMVRTPGVQGGGGAALGVRRVGRDDHVGQVETVEQGG